MSKEIIRTTEDFFRKYPASFDHDGVMADTRSLVAKKVNERFGSSFDAYDLTTWHWVYEVALSYGMSDLEAKEFEEELWYGETLLEAEPMPGLVEIRKWFCEKGLSAPTVSSRNPELLGITREWYRLHMPFIEDGEIIINPSDEMRGDWFKVFAVQSIAKSAVHFEDSLDHSKKILDYTKATVVLLSASNKLDGYYKNRLIRIYEKDYSQPNLMEAKSRLLKHAGFDNVAQY